MKEDKVEAACGRICATLKKSGITVERVDVRRYPDEVIFVVIVPEQEFNDALLVTETLDEDIRRGEIVGFVTIRKGEHSKQDGSDSKSARGVSDSKAEDLANLLTARSRTSEIQPSLEYIRDAEDKLKVILTSRNHLIFGRRGAGKTTLMVEAKRMLEAEGHAAVWVNMQMHRHASPEMVFVWIAIGIVERVQLHFGDKAPKVVLEAADLAFSLNILASNSKVEMQEVTRLIPRIQKLVKRFVSTSDRKVYIFLDDLHYLRKNEQPILLDMVHGVTRDVDAWIKVACIKHLSKWFEHSPPTGLQTGHDADHIDLDLTLESPTEAKRFLDQVLNVYAKHVGLVSARRVFSEEALSRLVLASGAVPRDYLVLAASAIRTAKRRQNARLAGVQDVNRAAGDQSKVKIAELEDDAAATTDGGAQAIITALNRVRTFCLDDKRYTFFKIDFRDKETNQRSYNLMQSLLDVRILHLIASSLSDKREAGRRSEVFMLDLSQFSGQRLKKRIHVLDFEDSHLVLKETSSSAPDRQGNTPTKLQEILRGGPTLELSTVPHRDA